MAHGLPRKIRIAFLLQVVMVSLAVVACGWAVTSVIKHGYLQRASAAEADHFFSMRASDVVYPVPHGRFVRGWFVPPGGDAAGVPPRVARLDPGYHELLDADQVVRVDRRAQGTLYLAYDRSRIDGLLYSFAVLPILGALLAVFVVSWLTYQLARRFVAPVNWLAREVARWDPRAPDVDALAPANLPPDVGHGEAGQLARALLQLGRRVEAFVSRERQFTRDASHELRTPLTVIRMGADLLESEPLSARALRSLARIRRASHDMEAVIDAFLILAREAEVEPLSDDFRVRAVVEEEIEKARLLLAGKPVALRITGEGDPVLHAPPRVLGVMLGNLLGNACTWTDDGEIVVRVEPDRVIVRDTGVGMDAAQLASAFDPFYRGDRDSPREVPQGTAGLGLSIVRRLGERFGWPVSLDSAPGRGTTATILFDRKG